MVGMGVKAGVPDVLIFTPPPAYPDLKGAAIELKAPGGKLSPHQRGWLVLLAGKDWAVACCVGIDAAIMVLKEWGYIQ
jgi:hypothetical protein